MSSKAVPTAFHHLLKALDHRGSLLRVYSQNIDGLEKKAGLNVYDPPLFTQADSKCILLHGSIHQISCNACCAARYTHSYSEHLESGILPQCPDCLTKQDQRKIAGKRARGVPFMLPNVVLYGQQYGNYEYVQEACGLDLGVSSQSKRKIDLLLVVGTSLKIPGTINIVKQFAKLLKKDQPKSKAPRTIYLDLGSLKQEWKCVFDLWIQADCQVVSTLLLEKLQTDREKPETR